MSFFHDYSGNATVLASDKVLFFQKTFGIIPLEQILSTKFVNKVLNRILLLSLSTVRKSK